MVPHGCEVVTAEVSIPLDILFSERHYEVLRDIFADRPDVGQLVITHPVSSYQLNPSVTKDFVETMEKYEIVMTVDMPTIKHQIKVQSVMEDIELVLNEIMRCSVGHIGKMLRYH